MEIYFSARAEEDLVLYINEHYPQVTVGLTSLCRELAYALEKQGNKVYCFDDETIDERARLLVAIGDSEAIDKAKVQSLPYVVLSKDISLSSIQNIAVKGCQIMEYNYPNAVFIDTVHNEYHLQAEVTALALGVILESVGIVGSGLRTERAKDARDGVVRLMQTLADFKTTKETLEVVVDVLRSIGGAPFYALLDRFTFLRCAKNVAHARFYSIFSLLYLIRLFTKMDFCAILPYMDVVRVRTLCEEMGISSSASALSAKDLTYKLSIVDGLVPSIQELKGYLDRFWLEEGRVNVDFSLILTNVLLSASKAPKTNMLVDLVEAGFIDALLDSR